VQDGRAADDANDHEPRLFVAVPLSDAIQAAVGELVNDVRAVVERGPGARRNDRPVRWVRLDSLHLTLRFLGATPLEQVPIVADAVREVARRAHGFEIELGGAGAFPSSGRPRTLWLGVHAGAESLSALASDLHTALAGRGWPVEERPFRPHLTLARADGVRAGPRTASALETAALGRQWSFTAERVVLFESHMGSGPARYEALEEVAMGAALRGAHG
jgi:RNA 2',3'-cyclic 3'-phosphodiesterase